MVRCLFAISAVTWAVASGALAGPAYRPKGHNAWDFWFAKDGDTYHAFYLEYPDANTQPDQSRRHGGQWVGHAVSKDLVRWEERPTALKEAPARGIATGSCVRDDKRWCMLVTYQGFTLAESTDLERWTWAGKAIFPADLKAEWKGEMLNFRLLADPYVYPEKIEGWWYAAINAQVDGVPKEESGAQVLMRSRDLLRWETHRVISFPRKFERMETAQFWEKNGKWYLHFGGAGGKGGSHVYLAERFDGPYEEQPWSEIKLPGIWFYLGKRVVAPDGGDLFLAGQDYAGLSLPYRMIYSQEGAICFEPLNQDVLLADFEGSTYGAWTAEGTAFGTGPAKGTLPGQMNVEGFEGKGLVNSFLGGDGATGTLTSPAFKIERKFITFLIGGGGWKEKTCMNLLLDNKVVRTATGPNVDPGGSEALEPGSWDVSDLIGKEARLQIVDNATGGWGHINVDQIAQSDQGVATLVTREHELTIDKRYLHFPMTNGAKKGKKQRVAVLVDGAIVREFEADMSEEPDWYAHMDMSAWQGEKATIRVDKVPEDSKLLEMVAQADTIWNAEQVYKEPLRAQLRFSARRGWLNDPNGMVYADGEYHLYFQHNPYGWPWGNMHWGHAVSKDMVHWEELPITLYPKKFGDWAFSGGAVVDKDNTSGWKKGTNSLIVVTYTSTGRGECVVYSNDRGRTFQEFEGNPIIKHGGRDPLPRWYAPGNHWVIAVYDEFEKGQYVAFYTSTDMKTWTFQSRIAGFYECADLFELPVGDKKYWVVTAASSDYMVGQFDGKTFTPETPKLKGHLGRGFYAAQTFSNEPKGRTVQIGWLQTATPGMPFNQAMSLPNELKLRQTAEGPRLTWTPVKELETLRDGTDQGAALADFKAELMDVRVGFEPGDAEAVELTIRGAKITYDVKKQEIVVNGHRAPAPLVDGKQNMTVYVDRTVLEVFASDGLTYIPFPFVPKAEDVSVTVEEKGGKAKGMSLQAFKLKSCWSHE